MTPARPEEDVVIGGCLCGAVRFRVRSQPRAFHYCHCSRCRKSSGSAHAANLIVPGEEGVEWLSGESGIRRFAPEDGTGYFLKSFCSACGAPVPSYSSKGGVFVVPAGSIEEDPPLKPQDNIFWGSRASWYEPVDTLPCFETYPMPINP